MMLEQRSALRSSLMIAFTLALATGLLPCAAARASGADPLDERISIDLKDAKASEVMASFAKLTGATFDVSPSLAERLVTITLRGVRVRTALDAVCESIESRWERPAGVLNRVRVTPDKPAGAAPSAEAPQVPPAEGPLDTAITLELKDASGKDVMTSFGQLLDSAVDLDPLVTGSVTISLKAIPVRIALDSVCSQLHCTWTIDSTGAKPTLRVRRAA